MRLQDGTIIPTTRNLIRVTGWIATARIAYQAQQYVIRKRDAVATYRAALPPGVTVSHSRRKRRAGRAGHMTSRNALENHVVDLYRQFVLDELAGATRMPERRRCACLSALS